MAVMPSPRRRSRSRGLHDGDRGVFVVDRDICELGVACGLLENAHGDQPSLYDPAGHWAGDTFGVNPALVFRKIEWFERLA